MSGFASGNLILKSHSQLVEKHMASASYLIELNEKWLGYFVKKDGGFYEEVEGGKIDKLPPSIREMSRHFPVLNLVNMEDHGWSFCILQDDTIKSSLILSYEYEETYPMAIAVKEYGDFGALYGDEGDEIRKKAQETMGDYIAKLFDSVNYDAFRLFGIDDTGIATLKSVFCADSVAEDRFSLASTFYEILLIGEEMEYLNYAKVCDYIDDFVLVAKK